MRTNEEVEAVLRRAARPLTEAPSMADAVMARIAGEVSKGNNANRENHFMKRHWKIAAGFVAAVSLVAAGWAGEAARQAMWGKEVKSKVIEVEPPTTMPDGKTVMGGTVSEGAYSMASDGGESGLSEPQHKELAALVAEKKYRLLGKIDSNGTTMYEYKFTFSDGESKMVPFLLPLEKFATLEGYRSRLGKLESELDTLIGQKKYKLADKREFAGYVSFIYEFALPDGITITRPFQSPLDNVKSMADLPRAGREYAKARNKAILTAIAKGRQNYRLIDVEPMLVHICKDVATGKTLEVQKITVSDGKDLANAREPVTTMPQVGEESVSYETTWAEHLQAIREGKRLLIDVRIIKGYSYEVTLEDGSKVIYMYGGDDPLEKMMTPAKPPASATSMFIREAS